MADASPVPSEQTIYSGVDCDTGRRIEYRHSAGYGVIGDIIIGTIDELNAGCIQMPRALFLNERPDSRLKFNWGGALWPDGIVPYTINIDAGSQHGSDVIKAINDAIQYLEAWTAVRFVARTSEIAYVEFRLTGDPSICGQSSVGRKPNGQVMLIRCADLGTVLHEMLHTLGFTHEHQRPDRDTYVTVHAGSCGQIAASNFFTQGPAYGPYDYASIMHYERVPGCIEPWSGGVILPRGSLRIPILRCDNDYPLVADGFVTDIGQSCALSDQDHISLDHFYPRRPVNHGALAAVLQALFSGADQAITFGPLGNRLYGSGPVQLNAAASSGLPVTFASLTPSVCTVSGSAVSLLNFGTCTIRASQPGDSEWDSAADEDRSFNVVGPEMALDPAALSGGTVGVVYQTQTLVATGGTPRYFYSVASGGLPNGLELASSGSLSGTPKLAGTWNSAITATDSSSAASGGPFAVGRVYTITIAKAISSTSLTANPHPTAPQQTVTLTAVISVTGVTPTGTVNFRDGNAFLCTGVPLVSAQAQCSTSALSIGNHSITAVYSGNFNIEPSTSLPLTHTVVSAGTSMLTVIKRGSGSGVVTSAPGGIDCGIDCDEPYAQPVTVTLTATPAAGNLFTGWLGACTGRGTCQVTMNTSRSVSATFAPDSTHLNLDIDNNKQFDALTDGVLIMRGLFGVTGAALTNGAIGPGSTRTSPAEVQLLLSDLAPLLDVDGDGQSDPVTDGLLILRYLFGMGGPALTANAIGPGATRSQSEIESYLQGLVQ